MKAKFLIQIALLLITLNLYSQQRVNKKLPKIGTQIIGQLTSAMGWVYNPEGQWVSRPNRIPVYIENKDAILIDYEKNSLGIDNFISYELRPIKIDDRNYFIFLRKYKTGFYEFSKIEKGWLNYKTADFYVFDSVQFSKINSINLNKEAIINLYTIYWGSIDIINELNLLSDIEKEIIKQLDKSNEYNGTTLEFIYRPYKEKGLIQFAINISYECEKTISKCFEKYYYETESINFKKLFGTDLHLKYNDDDLEKSKQNTKIGYKQEYKNDLVDVISIPEIKEDTQEKTDRIYTVVEEMPEFNGGQMELTKYIQQNLKSFKMPKDAGFGGKCFLKFVIDVDGTVKDISILKGVPNCSECDEEAKKIMLAMPKWKPGKQSGKAVQVFYNQLINFYSK